ncbi:MAG: hypothetical protein U9N53_09300 [Bacteroidota bacterium]|nr:hypothetical protein [Bacteroidota bacterium]
MIIRATKKLMNTSGVKPVKNLKESDIALPGEWYAGLVSTGRPGKMLIHFLHTSTKLSILYPGKSLNKALQVFPGRVEQLLGRLGYSKLVFQFQLHTKPDIYTTNSRSMLSHMTQLKYAIEYSIALSETFEDIDYDEFEDSLSDMLLSSKGPRRYEKPTDILQRLVNEL